MTAVRDGDTTGRDVERQDVAEHLQHKFTATFEAPADARAYVRTSLARLVPGPVPDTLCDDAQLIVSELVTNAVRAGSGAVRLALRVRAGHLRIEVGDDVAGVPVLGRRDVTAHGGRGLPLVSALAADWGVEFGAPGKTVWATLTL